MPITNISRDWGIEPQIVRITTTDSLATIMANGYWATQVDVLKELNKGTFTWLDTDLVCIAYNGGKGFFNYDATNDTFDPTGTQTAQVTVTSAQILGMNAAPVQIIAAPGANRAIMASRMWQVYRYGGVQYAAGGAISYRWGATANLASSTLAAATFNAYAANNAFDLTPDGTDTLANIAGLGLFLSNDTAAFTTGDGTLICNVNYNIVPTV